MEFDAQHFAPFVVLPDSMNIFRRAAIPLLLLVHLLPVSAAEPAARSNVLLICVDDLKPLLGCYGDKLVKTPNIDRLAARGMLFERAYCNQAVCAPSRNALMTGLRPTTLGIYDLSTNFRHAVPEAITLSQQFMQHGYRAEAIGKIYHIGHGNGDDPKSWSVKHQGGGGRMYAIPENRPAAAAPSAKAGDIPRGPAYESADVTDAEYNDGKIAEGAIQKLQRAKENAGQPFFIGVGFIKPHLPFCAPKKYWDLYDPASFALAGRRTPPDGAPKYAPQFGGELRRYKGIPTSGDLPDDLQRTLIHGYHASVSYMDAQVGRVLDELDRLELTKNTIVVLWGDHGWHLGDHGIWCKHTNYEEATRIPLLISAPGVTQAGTRTKSLIETVDLYPTLCELAGLPAPTGLDGASAVAVLRNPSAMTKETISHVYPRGVAGQGTFLGRAVRDERYRLIEWKKPGEPAESAEIELYDYEKDPGETRNLAAESPEIVAKLRQILGRQPEAKPQLKVAGAESPRRARRQ
jgi:iduronate 2-sulfatase